MSEITDVRHLARRIRELRQARNLSQEEFARQAGCSRSTISALERGKAEHLSGETVRKILRLLTEFRSYEDVQAVTFPGSLRHYAKQRDISFSEAERLLLSDLRPPAERTEDEWELIHRLLTEYAELFEVKEQSSGDDFGAASDR